MLGPSPLTQSHTRPSLVMIAMNYVHLGSLLSPRSFSHLNSAVVATDPAVLSSTSFMRSFGRTSLVSMALDHVHPDASTFLRSITRFGAVAPTLDYIHSGFLSTPRSSARLEPLAVVSNFLHIDAVLPFHSSTQVGVSFSVFGVGCSGSSVIPPDSVLFGSFTLLRSTARLGLAVLATDLVTSGPSMSARLFA